LAQIRGKITDEFKVVVMNTEQPSAAIVTAEQLLAFVDRIADRFKPERIVLFGSYACGSPTEDSDVDLNPNMPSISCRTPGNHLGFGDDAQRHADNNGGTLP
jgi:hypothetical protein